MNLRNSLTLIASVCGIVGTQLHDKAQNPAGWWIGVILLSLAGGLNMARGGNSDTDRSVNQDVACMFLTVAGGFLLALVPFLKVASADTWHIGKWIGLIAPILLSARAYMKQGFQIGRDGGWLLGNVLIAAGSGTSDFIGNEYAPMLSSFGYALLSGRSLILPDNTNNPTVTQPNNRP